MSRDFNGSAFIVSSLCTLCHEAADELAQASLSRGERCHAKPNDRREATLVTTTLTPLKDEIAQTALRPLRRRATAPSAARPAIISAYVSGSGTGGGTTTKF